MNQKVVKHYSKPLISNKTKSPKSSQQAMKFQVSSDQKNYYNQQHYQQQQPPYYPQYVPYPYNEINYISNNENLYQNFHSPFALYQPMIHPSYFSQTTSYLYQLQPPILHPMLIQQQTNTQYFG